MLKAETVKHWGENEGLSSRWTDHGIQDHNGFIWIATKNGLNRFDGYNFLIFNTYNLPDLVSNQITYLLVDKSRKLWIGTENGINILDLDSYKIESTLLPDEINVSASSNFIRCIISGVNGEKYITTYQGTLYKYTNSNGFSKISNQLNIDGNFGSRTSLALYNEHLYVYSENLGGYKVELKSGKTILHFGQHQKQHVGKVKLTNNYGLLFCSKENIEQFNEESDSVFSVFPELGTEIYTIIEDSEGKLWSIKDNIIRSLQYIEGSLNIISYKIFDSNDNVRVMDAFEDSSKNLWFFTNNGVYKMANDKKDFISILRKDQFESNKYISSFRGIIEDSLGNMFFGGYGGLFKKEVNGKITRLFDQDPPYTLYSLFDKNIEELYALCEGFGVQIVNKNTGKAIQAGINYNEFKNYKGLYLIAGILANDGDFWLSSYDYILRFNPKNHTYYRSNLKYYEFQFTDYPANEIKQLSNGDIWFCTNFGIYILDSNNRIKHYGTDEKGKFNIPFDIINCVYEDSMGNIWVGSGTDGLLKMTGNKSQVISIYNNLANNKVASIQEDNEKNIWVATNNGLSKIVFGTNKIQNFYKENGLSSNEFNKSSSYKSKSGDLFFGGVDGINIYNSFEMKENSINNSKLHLSKCEIPLDDKKIKTFLGSSILSQNIELNPNLGYFYCEFFIDDYLKPSKNTFQYKLEGYNKNWISIASQNHVRFAGLSSGFYKLRIKGTNASGIDVPNEIIIPFIVNQVFYKTWWFIALFIIFSGLIVAYIVKVRFQKMKEISDMRIRLASDLHDEVGGVLSRITMQAEILAEESNSERKNMLQSIAKNGRKAMSSMRDMIWSIDARKADFGSLFDKIVEYGQQIMEGVIESYQFNIDPTLSKIKINPIYKQEIYYIYKEAINNLLKHSDKKRVLVEAKRIGSKFELSVYSSGKIQHSGPITGSGLMNMEMRATRIKGNVRFEATDGFKVILTSEIR